jgi:hypothetical protein
MFNDLSRLVWSRQVPVKVISILQGKKVRWVGLHFTMAMTSWGRRVAGLSMIAIMLSTQRTHSFRQQVAFYAALNRVEGE